jgi:hypothetical protein
METGEGEPEPLTQPSVMTAKQIKINALLNQILTSTGCDKSTAILIAAKGFTDQGLTASQALDLICGEGATRHIAGEAWELFQTT